MLQRLFTVLIAGCFAASFAVPVAAQSSNIDTVEGPGEGERSTLTITPHVLTDDVSARAVAIQSPNSTRWALTLIGIARTDSLSLTLENEPLPIEDISRPEEGEVGPTRVYLSEDTFLTIAESPEVRLGVGNAKTTLPEQMRTDMQLIFDDVL